MVFKYMKENQLLSDLQKWREKKDTNVNSRTMVSNEKSN
jgi:hypothetical protein